VVLTFFKITEIYGFWEGVELTRNRFDGTESASAKPGNDSKGATADSSLNTDSIWMNQVITRTVPGIISVSMENYC